MFAISYFKKLIMFTIDCKMNVINLSQITFEDLKMAKPAANSSSKLVFLEGQAQPALCISLALVEEDKLQRAEGIYPTKSLHAVLHKQEYELMVANLCHLMDVPFIRSQIVDNFWPFTTRPGSGTDDSQKHMEQSPLRFPGLHLIGFFLLSL